MRPTPVHFRAAGVSVLVETGPTTPRVLHWGADLGQLSEAQLRELALAELPAGGGSVPDGAAPLGLLPQESQGWLWTPALRGHRDGRDFSALLLPSGEPRTKPDSAGDRPASGGTISIPLADRGAGLVARIELELDRWGVLRLRAIVGNAGEGDYWLESLTPVLPLPGRARELLDFTGRWTRERHPVRYPLRTGVHRHESRRGKGGFDASAAMVAGTPGFAFRTGEVWAVHTAWSGSQVTFAQRTDGGVQLMGGGELLAPGEVRLAPGEEYASPWLVAAYGQTGMDEAAARFHAHVRAMPHRQQGPRPVMLNTWEATYFDQSVDTLTRLADLGARVGAEVFVLDDGWFRGRRSDRAGLGDWEVDPDVWPGGLTPLVDHVRGLGMQFGLWVEPEMVSPDSDVARAHPEWICAPSSRRLPLTGRNQQVLNLAIPGAYDHVARQLHRVLDDYPISFLKWDHNRDLLEAGFSGPGRAAVHAQTLAAYRLMDELKQRHPGLRIESCASGGGRIDLEMLSHADRIWGSDCIDAIERLTIQRWTALAVPPELIGSHVGAEECHTTGRRLSLDLRCATALFGWFGIEADLSRLSDDELDRLAGWVALYKRFAGLMATGTLVHDDTGDDAFWLHGVVAADRSEALYQVACLATIEAMPPGMVRLPGLDPRLDYRVEPIAPTAGGQGAPSSVLAAPPWWSEGVVLPGRVLEKVGIQAPALLPESQALVHVVAEG